MRIDIIAAVPELLSSLLGYSIIRRAQTKNLIELRIHSLFDHGLGKYRQIDDYPYGGGGGMVLRPEPIASALESIMDDHRPDDIIFLTPEGQTWNQKIVNLYSQKKHLIILCGHYKGIDQRIIEYYKPTLISIGDFVLTGGEIASAVIVDSIVRLIPGVVGDEMSTLTDSFQDGLLSAPVYTRPYEWRGLKVPEVLICGNPEKIDSWRLDKAIEKTRRLRPDLLDEKNN